MKHILLFLCLASVIASFGQVTDLEKQARKASADTLDGWKNFGDFSLGGSQTSLTNWNSGGQNSIAINSLFNYNLNYKKGTLTWENRLTVGYGLLKQGKSDWLKTDDRLEIFSKIGKKVGKGHWYYAGVLNFLTQITPGYIYPTDSTRTEVSKFLAPGYMLTTLGMDYRPNDNFSLYIAPLAGKYTFVNDDTLANAGAFGVEAAVYDDLGNLISEGRKFRAELGAYLRAQYKTQLTDNIKFSTSLGLFSNYIVHPDRIDVNWETLTLIDLWKNKLVLGLNTHLIYDDDVNISVDTDGDGTQDAFGPRVQFKEVFTLGLTFKF